MIKLNKNLLLTASVLVATVGFGGCGSTATNTANSTNTANTANTTTNSGNSTNTTGNTSSSSNTAANTTMASADKIGVPECDDYIEKYEACLNSKVPEAQRAAFKSSFETMRKTWKASATNPQTKSALASGCKQAHDAAKQSMSAFSCAW
jgi:hypothetical protein